MFRWRKFKERLLILSKETPKFEHELFLDRTHGKRMGEMLRRAGFRVRPIYEVYPGTAHDGISDPQWIRLCGENGWVAISGDKRLETVPENRQAVIDAKAKVFVLTDSNSPPEMWAAAIILGHYRMSEMIDGNQGPFFVSVGKRSDGHIARLRLPPGYTPPEHIRPASQESNSDSVLRLKSADDQV
jgi:hypothetical protein